MDKAVHLHSLSDNKGAFKKRKRVGRGPGSGLGKTGGRGMKGQSSRSGVAIKGFEGGQMPIHMRMPKRGFNSLNKRVFRILCLSVIDKAILDSKIHAGSLISPSVLEDAGIVSKNSNPVKILSGNPIGSKIILSGVFASKSAIRHVEEVGGKITLISRD